MSTSQYSSRPRWLMVAAALAGAAGCSSSSDPTPTESGLARDLKLSAMTGSQREAFCDQMIQSSASCAQSYDAGVPVGDAGASKTPRQACLESFSRLPDCTAAMYDACRQQLASGACTAEATSPCAAIASCTSQSAPSNETMTQALAYDLCEAEFYFTLGIMAAVYDNYRYLDGVTNNVGGVQVNYAFSYCMDYRLKCNAWPWQKGCLCAAAGTHTVSKTMKYSEGGLGEAWPEFQEVCP